MGEYEDKLRRESEVKMEGGGRLVERDGLEGPGSGELGGLKEAGKSLGMIKFFVIAIILTGILILGLMGVAFYFLYQEVDGGYVLK